MISTLLHVYLSLHCRFIVTKCNILSKHPVFAIYKVLMKKAQVREFVCYVLVIIAHLAMGFSSLFCLFMIQHYMSVKEWFSSSQFSTDKFCWRVAIVLLSLDFKVWLMWIWSSMILKFFYWLIDWWMERWIDWLIWLCEIPAITFVIFIFLYNIAQYYMWFVCYTCIQSNVYLYYSVFNPLYFWCWLKLLLRCTCECLYLPFLVKVFTLNWADFDPFWQHFQF